MDKTDWDELWGHCNLNSREVETLWGGGTGVKMCKDLEVKNKLAEEEDTWNIHSSVVDSDHCP